MAVIEFQIRAQAFVDYFVAEVNLRRLPAAMVSVPGAPELDGRYLERIQCLGCTLQPSQGQGSVNLQLDVAIDYHLSLADVRAAGSLQRPATQRVHRKLPGTLSIGFDPVPNQPARPKLQWVLVGGSIPGGSVPLKLPEGITVASAAVEASATTLAIRLATQTGDVVNQPVVDRLGPDDWAEFVPGDVFADLTVSNLDTMLKKFVTKQLVVSASASGTWVTDEIPFLPLPPFALASAELTAVDSCPFFNIDVPVALSLIAWFEATGAEMVTTVRLAWDVDSTVCDIVGGVYYGPFVGVAVDVIADDQASDAVLGHSADRDGFKEIDHSDTSITYRRVSVLKTPSPRFALTHSEVDATGLIVGGTLTPATRGGLEGFVAPAKFALKTDCTKRQVTVVFNPATITLHDYGIGGAPRLFPGGVILDPPNSWSVVPAASASSFDLDLAFIDPPTGRLPAGTATSVFLITDCGVRWVDLGAVPADRPPPTDADRAEMISGCMTISDPWGLGAMNLQWLIDPPETFGGFDPVRQWTVGFRDLPARTRLTFVAVDRDNNERLIGVIDDGQGVAVEVSTAADETLQVRVDGVLEAPAPVVTQRWITPFASLELDGEAVTLAAHDGSVALMGADGIATVVDAKDTHGMRSSHGNIGRQPLVGDIAGAVTRAEERGTPAWATAARVGANTVAVLHRGALVIGSTGSVQQL